MPELDSEVIGFSAASEFFAEYRKLKNSDLKSLRPVNIYLLHRFLPETRATRFITVLC